MHGVLGWIIFKVLYRVTGRVERCIMGTLLTLGSLVTSETPTYSIFRIYTHIRWLLDNNYHEDGMIVITMRHGGRDVTSEVARDEYREIKRNILIQRSEGERSY